MYLVISSALAIFYFTQWPRICLVDFTLRLQKTSKINYFLL